MCLTLVESFNVFITVFLFNADFRKKGSDVLRVIYNGIARTFSTGNILSKDVFFDKVLDISYGCVFGTFCQCSPSLGRYFSLITVKEQIQYICLPLA